MQDNETIQFPVFVCETETGDFEIYFDIDELRRFVEEFWDILNEDFMFFDESGDIIEFEPSFLEGKGGAFIKKKSNFSLKTKLLRYADSRGLPIANRDKASIINIANSIWNVNKIDR